MTNDVLTNLHSLNWIALVGQIVRYILSFNQTAKQGWMRNLITDHLVTRDRAEILTALRKECAIATGIGQMPYFIHDTVTGDVLNPELSDEILAYSAPEALYAWAESTGVLTDNLRAERDPKAMWWYEQCRPQLTAINKEWAEKAQMKLVFAVDKYAMPVVQMIENESLHSREFNVLVQISLALDPEDFTKLADTDFSWMTHYLQVRADRADKAARMTF